MLLFEMKLCCFVFIPFHIDSFPTQWKEETHSGASGRNAIYVALQHPVGNTHTHGTLHNYNSTGDWISDKSWLFYLCTCCWWKPIRPSCQRPSHSPSSITRSACGASMLLTIDGEKQLAEDKEQSTRHAWGVAESEVSKARLDCPRPPCPRGGENEKHPIGRSSQCYSGFVLTITDDGLTVGELVGTWLVGGLL